METSKLITVVVWATIVLVAYELYKQLAGSAAQLGGGTSAQAAAGTTEIASSLTPPSLILASVPTFPADAVSTLGENDPWQF